MARPGRPAAGGRGKGPEGSGPAGKPAGRRVPPPSEWLAPSDNWPVEQRRGRRLHESAPVDIRIVRCRQAPGMVGRSFRGHVLDVSSRGLQMLAEQPLPLGTRMILSVHTWRRAYPYHLTGRVVWNHPTPTPGGTPVGIRLGLFPMRSLLAWVDMVHHRIRDQEDAKAYHGELPPEPRSRRYRLRW
jgi:hypothetical protein